MAITFFLGGGEKKNVGHLTFWKMIVKLLNREAPRKSFTAMFISFHLQPSNSAVSEKKNIYPHPPPKKKNYVTYPTYPLPPFPALLNPSFSGWKPRLVGAMLVYRRLKLTITPHPSITLDVQSHLHLLMLCKIGPLQKHTPFKTPHHFHLHEVFLVCMTSTGCLEGGGVLGLRHQQDVRLPYHPGVRLQHSHNPWNLFVVSIAKLPGAIRPVPVCVCVRHADLLCFFGAGIFCLGFWTRSLSVVYLFPFESFT